jgi:hypothetical protein
MAKKPSSTQKWKRPPAEQEENAFVFVHSALDTYGLDVYEFRVLAHVARREGRGRRGKGSGCFARQRTIADTCRMSQRKVQEVLRVLTEVGLLDKRVNHGGPNTYNVAPPSRWKDPSELDEIRKRGGASSTDETVSTDQLDSLFLTDADFPLDGDVPF